MAVETEKPASAASGVTEQFSRMAVNACAEGKLSYFSKRVDLFEQYKKRSDSEIEEAKQRDEKISVRLPDGKEVEAVRGVTTPLNIAKGISSKLSKEVLVAKVDGKYWDLFRPLEDSCSLELFKWDTEEGRHAFWHSSAHVLGQILELELGADLTIGPVIDEGFYYDCCLDGRTIREEDLAAIEKKIQTVINERQVFQRVRVSREEALGMFQENKFKVELINGLPEEEEVTLYRVGPMVDLCRGPHVPNSGLLKAYALTKASASYWRGDAKNDHLQRVYGVSYPEKKLLKEYLDRIEEAKKRDHRTIGVQQELFFFHELSPGSAFFLPKGAHIHNKLVEFIRAEYRKRGYKEVVTPNMYNFKLWETSGHAANYKENMFHFEVEGQEFGLKPMNCPGHCVMFDHRVRSYRELPLRLADFGVLHRNEYSGALSGLTRVRRFQQDDAHIFCSEDQVEQEINGVLDFLEHVYGIFGFTYQLELSTRPEKYLGDLELWEKAEKSLENALNSFGHSWNYNPGDGAFYGPKIDITVFDALKRKFQCATIQLDFQLPIRFSLDYTTANEDRKRPVMIHRAILGSVERMFAILTEHYAGKWPLWLSPRQAKICPVSEKFYEYAEKISARLHSSGFQVESDLSDRKLQKKIREAQLEQWNYILVVGQSELDEGTVNVRTRDNVVHGATSLDDLIAEMSKACAEYVIN